MAFNESLVMAARETELQKLLADERLRSEQHKMNYQTLKAEHQRLQDDYSKLQAQVKRMNEDKKQLQEANSEALQKSQEELIQTTVLLDELKSQLLTPQRVELLRVRIEEEARKKYLEAVARIEEEAEKYRNEYNKLRYEYTFVRTEYDHDKANFDRQLEEMKLRYESEITHLKKQKEDEAGRRISGLEQNMEVIKSLEKDNFRVNQKVQLLSQELSEAKSQRDRTDNQSSEGQRQLHLQLTELSARLKSLVLEKSSLNDQCKNVQRALDEQNDKSSEMKSQLTEARMEADRLKLQLEDAERNVRLEAINFQAQLTRQKADHERSNEAMHRLQLIRREDAEKTGKLKMEKQELEMTCKELERRQAELTSSKHEELSKLRGKVAAIGESKASLEKELLTLRVQRDNQSQASRDLEAKRMEVRGLQAEIGKLRGDLQATGEAEDQLVARNKELNGALEAARREIEFQRSRDDRTLSENEKLLHRREMKWESEKLELQAKMVTLEQRSKAARQKLVAAGKAHKKKFQKYSRLITKLRNRLELQNAKIEELGIEKEALKKAVPPDVHNMVKKELRELQRRQDEFRKLLQAHHLFGTEASLAPMERRASVWVFAEQELQQQQSLKAFQERLKLLRNTQDEQMRELMHLQGKFGPP